MCSAIFQIRKWAVFHRSYLFELMMIDFLVYFLSQDVVMYTADNRNIHSVDEV